LPSAGLGLTLAVAAALFVAYWFVPLSGDDRMVGALMGAVALAAVVPVLIGRVRAIVRSPHPVVEAGAAIALLFALVVVGPASTYYALAASDPAAFTGLETRLDALYFTLVLTSTVGFGDITPDSQAARAVTTLHIFSTFAFLAASVRLLTWAARQGLGHRGG
jgi:voltage-gated potassium channel